MESLIRIAEERIRGYGYRCGLDSTLLYFLEQAAAKHICFLRHSLSVALMAEAAAEACAASPAAAFAAALLHDIGKLAYPDILLGGEQIDDPEVLGAIFWHPIIGFYKLREKHMLCALVAGMHHEYRDHMRYGILQSKLAVFPDISQKKMATRLIAIVGMCDSLEAGISRKSIAAGFENGPLRGIRAQYGANAPFAELVMQISLEVLRQSRSFLESEQAA